MVPWMQFSCHIVLTHCTHTGSFHAYQEWDGGAGETVRRWMKFKGGEDRLREEEAFPRCGSQKCGHRSAVTEVRSLYVRC